MKLKSVLDKVFSQYVRQSSADHKGFVACFTCGVKHHWKVMHAGHYVTRYYTATRWDEENVHSQCSHCNINFGGNLEAYRVKLDEVYGKGKANELHRKSQKTTKLHEHEIADLLLIYRDKL